MHEYKVNACKQITIKQKPPDIKQVILADVSCQVVWLNN